MGVAVSRTEGTIQFRLTSTSTSTSTRHTSMKYQSPPLSVSENSTCCLGMKAISVCGFFSTLNPNIATLYKGLGFNSYQIKSPICDKNVPLSQKWHRKWHPVPNWFCGYPTFLALKPDLWSNSWTGSCISSAIMTWVGEEGIGVIVCLSHSKDRSLKSHRHWRFSKYLWWEP